MMMKRRWKKLGTEKGRVEGMVEINGRKGSKQEEQKGTTEGIGETVEDSRKDSKKAIPTTYATHTIYQILPTFHLCIPIHAPQSTSPTPKPFPSVITDKRHQSRTHLLPPFMCTVRPLRFAQHAEKKEEKIRGTKPKTSNYTINQTP